MAWSESVVTPEAVVLERDIAHLGSRFIGALIDALIQVGILFLALAAAAALAFDGVVILMSVAFFVAIFVYPTVAETVWRGRTVGKAAAKTRVIRVDGRPVTFPVALVRNLVRIVDFLPSGYAIGILSILLTRRAQRLGDLAAGTLVVYEVPVAAPLTWEPPPTTAAAALGASMDVGGLSADEYQVVRSFLVRRHSLEPRARYELATHLASTFRTRVEAPEGMAPEAFLEGIAAAFRRRG